MDLSALINALLHPLPIGVGSLVLPWAPHLAQVALELRPEAPERFAQLLVGVGWREGHFGHAGDYTPPGSPSGTGDWPERIWGPGRMAKWGEIVRVLGPVLDAAGKPHPGLVRVVPADGLGWGRGVLQLDWWAHHEEVNRRLPSGELAWTVPLEHVRLAGKVLLDYLNDFGGDERCGLAAYNAREDLVHAGIAEGDPDKHTTGGDYGRWILDHLAGWYGARS